MSETLQNLPLDLITDILSRLPVKSIGQFKCISKPWRSLLSSPSFVKAHLKVHIHDPEDLIFQSSISGQALYILALTVQSRIYDGIARKVNFSIKYDKAWFEVVASANGLVLLLLRQGFECCVVLMNPITLEAVELPRRPYVPDNLCTYAMCFDSSKDDYMILSISEERIVDAYSLKMKTWRRLADFPHELVNFLPGVFVNGRIHCLALSDSRAIKSGLVLAAFSLASEEFKEVSLPSGVEFDEKSSVRIRVLDGCLVLVCKSHGCIDVWMMRDYGVRDSWNKFATIQVSPCEIPFWEVICLLNENEIVLEKHGCQFISYNLRNGESRNMVIADYRYGFRDVLTFREGLLSPN